MESDTFRQRLLGLVQKSRRALRLYSAAVHGAPYSSERLAGDLSAGQVDEWREINSLLLQGLTEAAEVSAPRRAVMMLFSLRNRFQEQMRVSEADLVTRQKELVNCSQQGDFIRSATLATQLVRLKARMQAEQAAHHELLGLLKRTRGGSGAQETLVEERETRELIELLDENIIEEDAQRARPRPVVRPLASVIPLRRLS
jgi:hypothetical protein